MKDKLERYADRLTRREAEGVWEGVRRRAFGRGRSWTLVWTVGGSVAVAAVVLLVFVLGRGPAPDLHLTPVPSDIPVGRSPLVEESDLRNEMRMGPETPAETVEPEPKKKSETVRPKRSAPVARGGAESPLSRERAEPESPISVLTSPRGAEEGGAPAEAVAPPMGQAQVEEKVSPADAEGLTDLAAGVARREKAARGAEVADRDRPGRPEDREPTQTRADAPPPVSVPPLDGVKDVRDRRVPTAAAEQLGEGLVEGRIRDTQTSEPLAYANVILEGTVLGTSSLANGTYRIAQVPEGTYTVRVQMMGYAEGVREDVRVVAGYAAIVDFDLTETVVLDIGRVEVVPDRDEIHLESDASETTVRDRAFTTPGEPASEREPHAGASHTWGAVRGMHRTPGERSSEEKVHVRGGRSSEVRYRVDEARGARRSDPRYPPAHGGRVPPNGEPVDAMFFQHYGVNPFVAAEDDRLSTFAIDVDTGSYTVCRRYLEEDHVPPEEAVRVEEFINYFTHEYAPPVEDDFVIHLEAAPSAFGQKLVLLRVGLQGRTVAERARRPVRLVFVVDTSGSMGRFNRLGTVKGALNLLASQLDRNDRIGIVEFGTSGRVVLRSTPVADLDLILDAVDLLRPGGSTNAEEGLRLGYQMADWNFSPEAVNRVILCSDGVANMGRTAAEDILSVIKASARRGIYLTALGFGMGNYNDVLLERLADQGDGQYFYIDEMSEARRVLLEDLVGTLQTIGRDAKIQVEFDPKEVERYRLLGYENRDVADRDFRNDRVDAGEIGAGHQTTALYEVRLADDAPGRAPATVRFRWEDPQTGRVKEIERRLARSEVKRPFGDASWDFRRDAAVAEFAEILRGSYWAREGSLESVEDLVEALQDERPGDGQTAELLDLVRKARRLWKAPVYTNEWQEVSEYED